MMEDRNAGGCRDWADFHENRRYDYDRGNGGRDFRPGIPGDYVEFVDGTIPDTPFTRELLGSFPTTDIEEWNDLGTGEGDDHDGGDMMSLHDALMFLRHACCALTSTCSALSAERDAVVDARFMPPYCELGSLELAERNGTHEFGEIIISVDGRTAMVAGYDELCDAWMGGPDALRDWVVEALDLGDSIDTVMTTLHDILSSVSSGAEEDRGRDCDGRRHHGGASHCRHHDGHRHHTSHHGHHDGHRHHTGHHGHHDGHRHRNGGHGYQGDCHRHR